MNSIRQQVIKSIYNQVRIRFGNNAYGQMLDQVYAPVSDSVVDQIKIPIWDRMEKAFDINSNHDMMDL